MDISKENKLSELIMRHLQGDNSPQELQQLKELLSDNIEAVELYIEYMMQFSALNQPGKIIIEDFPEEPSPPILDTSLWMALSKYEMEAPGIELPKEQPQRELIQKVVYPPREQRRFSKFSIFMLLNVAAIFLVILFLRFTSPEEGFEVATLTDSINAKWAEGTFPIKNGIRMVTGKEWLLLRKGYAELLFDNQARVTLEGPAEFQILAEDRIGLNYGKLYVSVPIEAIGFSVYSNNAKIIDLGTEFGVQAEADGDTYLHVIKGKTTLIAGQGLNKVSVGVDKGNAKRVSAVSSAISDIPCNTSLFVREIESKANFVWKGEPIDLADFIGGGNGLGTGKLFSALTSNDRIITSNTPVNALNFTQSITYEIRSNSFVDCLFIPKGKTKVCSQEEIFTEFPDMVGSTFGCVTNGGIVAGPGDGWNNTLLLGGKEYGRSGAAMIHIHSNTGITFDLHQIRQRIPNLKIVSFTSLCGVTETVQQMHNYNSDRHSWIDFWVLVDGTIRFKKEHVSMTSGSIPINIALRENDRFLSLAVTDSDGSILFDWSIFAMPQLKIISNDD